MFPAYLGINLGQPDIPLLLLYAGSMYITQRMTITPTMDPQQAETQRMMTIMTPFMTTYFFLQYHLPSAFVLYYLTFNILSTAQQKYYMRQRMSNGRPRRRRQASRTVLLATNGTGGAGNCLNRNGQWQPCQERNANRAAGGGERRDDSRAAQRRNADGERRNCTAQSASEEEALKGIAMTAETMTAETMTAETETNALGAQALVHLQTLLETGELDARATQESQERETVTLAVSGPDAALLVGQHGQTLDALQHLLMLMTNKGQGPRLRLTVDADGYRARRAKKLTEFAHELAAEVGKMGQEACTDSLNPMERRIIHTALADHPDVETYSEGDEPNRYVVISPRQSGGG